MPYMNIKLTPGISREKKRQLVDQATRMLVELLGKQPEHVHIVIDEVLEENWGYAGMLTDDLSSSK